MNFRKERRGSLTRGLTEPRLRDGSSGGDHSRPSSSTAFKRMRRSLASNPALAALGADEGRRVGSAKEPDSSTASEAANDMLSSFSSSSLPPNKTRSLVLAEGRWSGWEKRTGETSLCGESEARGLWADVSLLSAVHWNPLPCCFFLTGPCEEENRRAQGVESLSEKKAIHESKEARLIFQASWISERRSRRHRCWRRRHLSSYVETSAYIARWLRPFWRAPSP